MPKRLLIILLWLTFGLALSGSARAASYAFQLQNETVNVYWQSDGTATIDYVFLFANDAGASPIDFVDVGLPTAAYTLSNVSAEVNGRPIGDIQKSTYVKYGVALGLGADAIAPGITGTVHALIRGVGQVLYPDDQDPAYVSAVFSPTWFDPALVHGSTDLTVIFHLPPGVQPAEPRYHTAEAPFSAQPEAALDDKGLVTYSWHTAKANGSTQYTLGASFPLKYIKAPAGAGVPAVVTSTVPYIFQVNTITATAILIKSGLVSISYDLDIANDAGAPPLDTLEMTVPNFAYSVAKARVGEQTVDISQAPAAIGTTVVQLGNLAIAPGGTGSVRIDLYATGVLQPDGAQPDYLTLAMPMPRFRKQQVHGLTNLSLSLMTGVSVKAADVRLPTPVPPHTEQLQHGATESFYIWSQAEGDATADHILRISIPASAIISPGSASPGSSASTSSRRSSGLSGLGAVVGVLGTIVAILSSLYSLFSPRSPVSVNRMAYLPPQVTIEGNGIKRGLTAVEAAVVAERPMDTVLTMILFAVLKKGVASVKSSAPLALDVADPLPEGLYEYERDFLRAFKSGPAQRESALQAALVKLVRSVSEKMRGFSRTDTRDYYQGIVDQAWKAVRAAETPEVKSQKLDELMDWALFDHYYQGRLMEAIGPNPVALPLWWGRYSPLLPHTPSASLTVPAAAPNAATGSPAPAGSVSSGASRPGGASLPGADFAASIANGVQSFSSQVVGDLQGFTGQITAQTNPAPVSSGYHGGGGHCACACACAGCACACAGGGR